MRSVGDISYEDYKQVQISRASKKWSCSTFWRNVKEFKYLINETIRLIGIPSSVCCMGIRNGNEYFAFKEINEFARSNIFGIDIHPAVEKVGPNCFSYDFCMLPAEWEKKFDWVYSNSLDHALDLPKTLKEWHRVCKGYLLLTLSADVRPTASDRYSFDMSDIETLFDKSLFEVVKVWPADKLKAFSVLLKVI